MPQQALAGVGRRNRETHTHTHAHIYPPTPRKYTGRNKKINASPLKNIYIGFSNIAPSTAFAKKCFCSSVAGRELFREALIEGNMESYFRLAEQFRTQDDPAFCGLSTLTMVLNALSVDPGRTWKGSF